MPCFYLKQLPAVPLLTPAHLSTTPSLFKHKTCTAEKYSHSKPKIICAFSAVSVGWSWGALSAGAPWWQHSCQRHWPPQVLLVTRVSLSALSVALVNNIQLSPRLCASPEQELRDTGSICPLLSLPALRRTESRGRQSPRKVCPRLQGLFAWSVVAPCWILLPELPCVKEVPTEPRWGCDWSITPCKLQTLLFLSLNLTATGHWCWKVCPFIFKHSKGALCSPHPLAFLYDPWLQLISKWRQGQLLQIAVMFKLAPWWIPEVANKKC